MRPAQKAAVQLKSRLSEKVNWDQKQRSLNHQLSVTVTYPSVPQRH